MHQYYNLDETSDAHDGSAYVSWLMDHRTIIRRFVCKFMPMHRHYTIRNSPYANRESYGRKIGKNRDWRAREIEPIQRRFWVVEKCKFEGFERKYIWWGDEVESIEGSVEWWELIMPTVLKRYFHGCWWVLLMMLLLYGFIIH